MGNLIVNNSENSIVLTQLFYKNILKEIETNLKCKLNGFTNLYTLFLLKSIHQLRKNGRCAYIIPSEFLNSDYGKLVKTYLIKKMFFILICLWIQN